MKAGLVGMGRGQGPIAERGAAGDNRPGGRTVSDLVLFDVDARGVATITLNRPDRLNAISMAMRDLLWEYLEACRDMPDVRVIVFRGEGRAFSAGADIAEFGTAPSLIDSRRARHERDVWSLLLGHRCATLAVMHGFCYGAGLELPLCCDVRIAVEGARFGLPEVTLGYIPSACATQTLPRLVPPGVAVDMIVSGEPIDATAALRWGLVDELVPAAEIDAAVEAAVGRLLAGDVEPRGARGEMRRSLPGGFAVPTLP